MITTTIQAGKLCYNVTCDTCGEPTMYYSQEAAMLNSKKCLFCRKQPKRASTKDYRRRLKNPTKGFLRWSKHNLENMRIKQGVI